MLHSCKMLTRWRILRRPWSVDAFKHQDLPSRLLSITRYSSKANEQHLKPTAKTTESECLPKNDSLTRTKLVRKRRTKAEILAGVPLHPAKEVAVPIHKDEIPKTKVSLVGKSDAKKKVTTKPLSCPKQWISRKYQATSRKRITGKSASAVSPTEPWIKPMPITTTMYGRQTKDLGSHKTSALRQITINIEKKDGTIGSHVLETNLQVGEARKEVLAALREQVEDLRIDKKTVDAYNDIFGK